MPIINGKFLHPWNVPNGTVTAKPDKPKPAKAAKPSSRSKAAQKAALRAEIAAAEAEAPSEAPDTSGAVDLSDVGVLNTDSDE